MTVGKGGKALAFGAGGDSVFKNLQIILEARGKKNTDRTDQLKALNRLYTESATTVYSKIRVLLVLVSSYFDAAAGQSGIQGFMPLESWTAAREKLNELLELLQKHSQEYVVKEVLMQEYDDLEERAPNVNGEGPLVSIRGNVVSLIERLDDEFNKSLQNTDPHAVEYVDRLKDEKLALRLFIIHRGLSLLGSWSEAHGPHLTYRASVDNPAHGHGGPATPPPFDGLRA